MDILYEMTFNEVFVYQIDEWSFCLSFYGIIEELVKLDGLSFSVVEIMLITQLCN